MRLSETVWEKSLSVIDWHHYVTTQKGTRSFKLSNTSCIPH